MFKCPMHKKVKNILYTTFYCWPWWKQMAHPQSKITKNPDASKLILSIPGFGWIQAMDSTGYETIQIIQEYDNQKIMYKKFPMQQISVIKSLGLWFGQWIVLVLVNVDDCHSFLVPLKAAARKAWMGI